MIELNKTLLNISSKFISYISDKWKLEKVSGKIEEFYLYDFEILLKELKKQKIVLQGMEEYSLKEIFDSEKSKIEELKKEIEKTDKEIINLIHQKIKILLAEEEGIKPVKLFSTLLLLMPTGCNCSTCNRLI